MFLSSTRRAPRRPLLGLLTAGALTAGLLGAAGAPAAFAAPASTTKAPATCPADGVFPDITTGPGNLVLDTGVAVYVGGNYVAHPAAAESEGLLVVAGDATFSSGQFNVGTVGGGSGVTPAGGAAMLVVGKDLTLESGPVQVGFGTDPGGAVVVGGKIVGKNHLETNGTGDASVSAEVTEGVGSAKALAPYAALGSSLGSISQDLARTPVNGRTQIEGNAVSFVGDGTRSTQVFSVSAAQLNSIREVRYSGLAAGTPVVINVSGDGVDFSPNYQALNARRVDDVATSASIGTFAGRVLWNFSEATSVTLGTADQFVGSVLVPSASSTVEIKTSTNGRLYVGGDLSFAGAAGPAGLEHHSYPWIGSGAFGCTLTVPPTTGTDGGEQEPSDPTDEPGSTDEPSVEPGEPGEGSLVPTPTATTPAPLDETTPVADPVTPAPGAANPVQDEDVPGAAATEDGGLAATGAQTAVIVLIAVALLAGGTWLVLLARRRAAASR